MVTTGIECSPPNALLWLFLPLWRKTCPRNRPVEWRSLLSETSLPPSSRQSSSIYYRTETSVCRLFSTNAHIRLASVVRLISQQTAIKRTPLVNSISLATVQKVWKSFWVFNSHVPLAENLPESFGVQATTIRCLLWPLPKRSSCSCTKSPALRTLCLVSKQPRPRAPLILSDKLQPTEC